MANLIFGFVLGTGIAISLIFLGPRLLSGWADSILTIMLSTTAIVCLSAFLVFTFRHAILKYLRLYVDAKLDQIVPPTFRLIDALDKRDRPAALKEGEAVAVGLVSWFSQAQTRNAAIAAVAGLLAIFGGILGATLLVRQNELIANQNTLVSLQNQLTEAQRRASLMFELSNVLDRIKDERDKYYENNKGNVKPWMDGPPDPGNPVDDTVAVLTRGAAENYNQRWQKQRPRRRDYGGNAPLFMVSDRLAGRIVALSRSLRPYRYLDDNGQLTPRLLSPERGQLLLSLLYSDIDMFELNHFKPVFDNADLSGVELSELPIEHLVAKDANFVRAKLYKVQFVYGRLQGANFGNADLNGVEIATLEGACLRGAHIHNSKLPNLRYADLTDAVISNTEFNDISYAKLANIKGWENVNWKNVRLYNVRDAPAEFISYARRHGALVEPDKASEDRAPLSKRGCDASN